MASRVEEGCLVVEMEASAFTAVARFPGVQLGQLLYAGGSLAGDDWDERDWSNAVEARARLFGLGACRHLRRRAPQLLSC